MMIDTARPRGFRYSLRTLLLVGLIIAVAAALFVTNRDLQRLRGENKQLRRDAGLLVVDNPSAVSVLQAVTRQDLTWRWSIYLPQGKWLLKCAFEHIPGAGLPEARAQHCYFPAANVMGKETQLHVSLRKGEWDQWKCVIEFEGGRAKCGLRPAHALTAGKAFGSESGGALQEETFDPDKPVVLLRVRAVPPSSPQARAPQDGIMIWLERAEN